MSRELKKGDKGGDVAEKVVVAVKASKEIPKTALVWALTHVVQPGNSITLLVLVSSHTCGRKLWGFPRFAGGCASGHSRRSHGGARADQKPDISDYCSQMILQLHEVYDPNKINVKIKTVSRTPCGAVAAEAKRNHASWVVLDKKLKQEEKRCMEELQCNIVVMRRSRPKVLRLNLIGSPANELEPVSCRKEESKVDDNVISNRGPLVTPSSSPETFATTEAGTSSVSSSPSNKSSFDFNGNLREVIALSRTGLLSPPPLCSICQHKAPEFGKPPRWFTYAELEVATGGFSQANFLAEGGFGAVHRGVLPDGETIAVKQHKLASSQGDQEFCSEVEVLSCAQHRNVVMLIGFCIEGGRRLLVYEYICNGSLDSHLYGCNHDTLSWNARKKIAIGAARGLRYLHEECRVGCIVHRDMRPNNILIIHDFEPLVGDFGLAQWQPDGETGVQTRVIGTFGYLAPEYAQSGQITEKADVYSFGVVLVELVTGRKAVDFNRPKGQQCLTEWARPFLEAHAIDELVDPRLGNNYKQHELYYMLHAASSCLSRDPQTRPRMSRVLRLLEGNAMDSGQISASGSDAGSRSGWIGSDLQRKHARSMSSTNELPGPFSFSPLRNDFKERDTSRTT